MYKGTGNPECVANPGLVKSTDWFSASRREHSRKPDEFYEYVMQRSNGPYLELYSRTTYPGWDVVGNQTDTFKL
jgi:N6-adenosine-specific RNA methylase IME4